ncbi:hypothetical protein R1sor_005319 [Riccia sorocarpa]|uniref:C2H2-type domain-containing protein n=1 Tax=Riccia sorocarpa TaxID=122646 RepID=A0ABD3HJ68_9MARC
MSGPILQSMAIKLSPVTGLSKRQSPPKWYHLVRDCKGRRTILCAIGACVQVFSEIPAFNSHVTGVHGRDEVPESEILQAWRSMTASCRKSTRKELNSIGAHDKVGNCHEFIRLRGTLAARWRVNKRRKFKQLMDRAVEFNDKRLAITSTCSGSTLDEQVRHTYREWKKTQKASILVRLKANLKETLMQQYNLTLEEATIQGGLNDNIIDTSDEES